MAKKTKSKDYNATVIVLGKTYKATGATISEAIAGLKPGNVRGRAVLSLTRGDNTKERIMMPIAAMRLFNTRGITQQVALKNVSLLYDGI